MAYGIPPTVEFPAEAFDCVTNWNVRNCENAGFTVVLLVFDPPQAPLGPASTIIPLDEASPVFVKSWVKLALTEADGVVYHVEPLAEPV
jgi:hypothetical protein